MSILDLHEVLMNSDMASFGDSLLNFVYSLSLSRINGKFRGGRVRNKVLAEALCRCGLRDFLSGKVDVHVKGDAVEALIAYAWISNKVSLDELVNVLSSNLRSNDFEDEVEAFSNLLRYVLVKIFEG